MVIHFQSKSVRIVRVLCLAIVLLWSQWLAAEHAHYNDHEGHEAQCSICDHINLSYDVPLILKYITFTQPAERDFHSHGHHFVYLTSHYIFYTPRAPPRSH